MKEEEKEGLQKARAYCSAAEHCRSEVRAMLERRDLSPHSIEEIIGHLEKEGYIDESRYSRAFVHDKVLLTKWGRIKIMQALRFKGIPEEIAEEAVSSVDPDEYMAVLRELLVSRYKSVKGADEYERKMKTMKSIAGRGFEIPLIREVLDFTESPDFTD